MRRLPWITVLAVVFLAACGDDENPARPTSTDPIITGTVTDTAGRSVEGASVVMVFSLDGYDPDPGSIALARFRTVLRYAVADPGLVTLQILDYAGSVTRVLVHGVQNPGRHEVTWDGLDDAGLPVPPGVYRARLRLELESSEPPIEQEQLLFFDSSTPSELVQRPHAVTDALGRFTIDIELVPLDEAIRVTDESGNELGMFPVSRSVRFFALRQDGEVLRSAQRDVTIATREEVVRVELVLP